MPNPPQRHNTEAVCSASVLLYVYLQTSDATLNCLIFEWSFGFLKYTTRCSGRDEHRPAPVRCCGGFRSGLYVALLMCDRGQMWDRCEADVMDTSYLSRTWRRGSAGARCVWCWAAWRASRRSHSWARTLWPHCVSTAARTAGTRAPGHLSPSLCLSWSADTDRTDKSSHFETFLLLQPITAWQVLKHGSRCRRVIGRSVRCHG